MSERLLLGNTARCGKTISQYYCPECKTKLERTDETLFFCPNCMKKVLMLTAEKLKPPEFTGHLKKSDPKIFQPDIIEGILINNEIEKLRRFGYSDEYINKKLGHLVNWRI